MAAQPHAPAYPHALELIAAMMLVALFGTGLDEAWHRHAELAVFAMTFTMTLPMVAWLRHRDHSRERSARERRARAYRPWRALMPPAAACPPPRRR